MRLRLTGSQSPRAPQDIAVTLPDGTVPLAEILRAAGADGFGEKVALNGRLVHVREPVGALPLYDGSAIDIHPTADPLGDHAVSLVEVAGGASGRIIPLPVGVHDIGRPSGPGRVEMPIARIGVEPGGAVTLRSVGSREVRLDGHEVTGPVLEPLRPGLHLGTGDTLLRIAPGPAGPAGLGMGGSPAGPSGPFVATHGTSGRVRYQRGPSATPGAAPPPPAPPDRPQPVRPAPPLSWAMVLAPIPLAIVLALVLNPRFLIFAAFSPILALARWQEGKWRERKERSRAVAARARDLEGYAVALQAHAAHGSARLRARTPDLAALRMTAEHSGPGLWSRRAGSAQFLGVAVGYGDLPANWELPRPGETDVDRVAARHRVVPDVPLILDLNRHQGAGFVSRDDPAAIAASAIVQLAATHGPADVQLALVCDPVRLPLWDWLKWLPHLQDAGGSPRVATTPDAVSGIFESVSPPGSAPAARPLTARPAASGRTLVVIVDSTVLLDTVLGRLAACPDRALVRLVVLGASPAQLPAVCTAVVSVSGGRLTLTDLAAPAQFRGALPVQGAPRAVENLARALARYVDPEADGDGAGLPAHVDLGFLLGGVLDPAHLAQWWRDRPGAHLYATLGATDEGPLVVDLLADGPHMLVAGTTGAGKSELLRTLVASLACRYGPDRVNFVLVDFKGGGAFDACADLPHTVGVVTDLDDQLAARALRCLRAELRHRELVLRAAGVGDLAQLPAGPGTPARLVLVIDEFATLAAELPDFMGSLVDIAQRGRSLGIHLVLATQRPAGVVDAKIRANTNLRLSLRVQSEADSLDVIGSNSAAGISRRTPGRGFARLGASELRGFQTALVSTATPVDAVTTVRVDPFELAPDAVITPVVRSAQTPSATGAEEPTDLRRIVAAAAELATPMPPARVPWPDPLPEQTAAERLWDDEPDPRDDAVLLGLTDRPDQQRIDSFHWTHRESSLIAYGADTATTTGVIVTVCAGLARRYPADALHIYLLDFVPGNGIERIAQLPNVAARVSPADHERLHRVVDLIDRELDRRREAVRRTSVADTSDNADGAGGADDASGDGIRRPLIVLGIAGYHVLTGLAEEIGRLDLVTRIERIATEGPELGIVTVLTTPHERGIPSRLASQIRARLVFRLADPNAYTSFGLRPRDVPNLRGSQAIDVATGEQIVVAAPEVVVSAGAGNGGPTRVATLGEHLPLGELDHPSAIAGTSWHLAVGVRHRDLTATGVDLPGGTHLVVTGPPASGRTTALHTLAESAVSAGASVRVLSSRPEEWDDVPTLALDEPLAGPTLVIVDGLDGASGQDQKLDRMVGDPRVRIAVADRQDAFRLPPIWLRAVLGARTGLLLQPQPDHGDLLRARLPMRTAVAHPQGRGYLVRGGLADLIQVAEPEPARAVV